MDKTATLTRTTGILTRLSDYTQLMKLRLSSLVVLSAALGFILGTGESINWAQFTFLVLGGVLVTGSANTFNQVLEKDTDRLMDRTCQRPLPDERMTVNEAVFAGIISGMAGLFVLFNLVNTASGMLGMAALALYAVVYTPLKRVTPFAVFTGAVPGAIPPMLGWVAATGSFDKGAWILLGIQFLWQFPHFWAIAWVQDDDYKKAGFALLPSKDGRDRASAFQVLIYSLSLVPAGLLPWFIGVTGITSALIISVAGIIFTMYAYRLYRDCTVAAASKVMFASFIYLPLVLIALTLDKI